MLLSVRGLSGFIMAQLYTHHTWHIKTSYNKNTWFTCECSLNLWHILLFWWQISIHWSNFNNHSLKMQLNVLPSFSVLQADVVFILMKWIKLINKQPWLRNPSSNVRKQFGYDITEELINVRQFAYRLKYNCLTSMLPWQQTRSHLVACHSVRQQTQGQQTKRPFLDTIYN